MEMDHTSLRTQLQKGWVREAGVEGSTETKKEHLRSCSKLVDRAVK